MGGRMMFEVDQLIGTASGAPIRWSEDDVRFRMPKGMANEVLGLDVDEGLETPDHPYVYVIYRVR